MSRKTRTPAGLSIRALGILMLFLFSGILSQSQAGEVTSIRWIGVDQLKKVAQEQGAVIVDLRTPLEFGQGHVPDAVNVPIEALRANPSALDGYKDTPVLLYCRTINKTNLALWLLEKRGFKSIYALRGGYEEYRLRGR
jgi:rhodanese-related sulfurtransferase